MIKFSELMNMMNGNFEVFTETSKHTIMPVCFSSDWELHEKLISLNVKHFKVEPNLNDNGAINWKYPCRIIVKFDN